MIVMKLGTISKLEKKNTMTPKKFDVDFLSANCSSPCYFFRSWIPDR